MENQQHSDRGTHSGRAGTFCAVVLALGASLAAATVKAEVLTFDGNICGGGQACVAFSLIDKSYGDIAGVVDVQYLNLQGSSPPGLDQLRFWDIGYNDLVNVAWTDSSDADSRAEIFIQPLNGGTVTLNSFDLGAFFHTQRANPFTVLDGANNVLFDSGGDVLIGVGDVHNHFSFSGLTSAAGIRIQWGPSAFNNGIDNVDFTVSAVPLPPAVVLLGGGLLALLGRRRRAA